MRPLILALLIACAAPSQPDAAESHWSRQATKELCAFKQDCLGTERDYAVCETEVLECGTTEVLSCTTLYDCAATAECLEAECGRGTGTGLAP